LDAGYDCFHVVGYDAEDAVVACCGGVEHLDGAVGGERHFCEVFELQMYLLWIQLGEQELRSGSVTKLFEVCGNKNTVLGRLAHVKLTRQRFLLIDVTCYYRAPDPL
jgi:hypothetical protein